MKNNLKASPQQIALKTPAGFFAFGFGSGLAPFAPGTFGTLMAIPLYYLMMQLSWPIYAFLTLMAFSMGVKLCDVTGNRLGVHDHGGIVWDEFVGFWITMFLIPFSWVNVVVGFALFRFFDIIKPWPIRWLDKKVKGGFGVMIDDVLAGIYGFICIYALNYYYPNYWQSWF